MAYCPAYQVERGVMEQGWQQDPSGRHQLRYHDGTKWTEHVADSGAQTVDPIPQTAPPPPPGPSGGIAPAPWSAPGPGPSGGISPVQSIQQPTIGQVHYHTRRVGKTRNPWGVWLLSIVTLGIYGLYWYYKVNEETREYSPTVNVQPGIALLAYMFGWLTCGIATIVTIVHTGGRISQCQQMTTTRARCSGGLGILFAILLGTHVVYYQSQLNKVWDQHGNPPPGTVI
jgi:hypothetical protein